MSDFVLDASCAIALYLPATPSQKAYASKVAKLLENGAVATVPGLFFAEVGSVLIKARRKRKINNTALAMALADMSAAGFEEVNIPYSVYAVVDAAQRYMLQGYDAVYFDLAKQMGIPIASLDRGHRSACKAHGVELVAF